MISYKVELYNLFAQRRARSPITITIIIIIIIILTNIMVMSSSDRVLATEASLFRVRQSPKITFNAPRETEKKTPHFR